MGFRSSRPKEWDCLSNHRGGPVNITAKVPGYADDVLGRAEEMRVTRYLSRGEGLLNVNPDLLAMGPLRVGRSEDRLD